MKSAQIRALLIPAFLLLLLFAAARMGLDARIAGLTGFDPKAAAISLAVTGWLAGTWLACQVMNLLVWTQIGRRRGRPTPHLLIQLTNLLIFFAAGLTMASFLFKVSLAGAIATSSVVGLVIGFAVKSLIADAFSGIALNLDSGFSINDFVQVVPRGIAGQKVHGRVVEISWRCTYIETPEKSVIVIPNSVMSESLVLNYSRPNRNSEFEMIVALDFEVPSERALRVVTAALNAAMRESPALWDAKVRISAANNNGINYKLVYMLDPAVLTPGKAKHLILGHLLQHLQMTGLSLAHPKVDNWNRHSPHLGDELGDPANRQRLLRHVDLFRGLPQEDVAGLAGRMTKRHYAAGDAVILGGTPGQSMFVLGEGLVSVRVAAQHGEMDVAGLAPGDFFGEMSLLTGEPRTASIVAVTDTVAFEIDRADLDPLLESNPAAAQILSLAAAERRIASDQASAARPEAEIEAERHSMAGKILAGMGRFLGARGAKPELVARR